MSKKYRLWVLCIASLCVLSIAAIAPPIPQPQDYHQFADQRGFLGIANFMNTVSSLALLLAGLSGLKFLFASEGAAAAHAFSDAHERQPYLVFFLGVGVAGIGSAYYHLAPDNGRLMWDRLPIALAIMALLAATLSERISQQSGRLLLPILVVVGVASVMHWHWTEQQGRGNLNFYIVAQFYSILVIVLLCIFFPSRYTHGAGILAAFAWYGVAKLAEIGDDKIFELGEVVSGHTAKHLIAALAACRILKMLKERRLRH